jgi:ubiquitin-like domain-containing CTD phosphatase 1
MEVDPPTHSDEQATVAAQGSLSVLPTSTTSGSSSSDNLSLELPQEAVYSLVMKWRGTNYEISIAESDTVVSTRSLFNPESSLNKPISQLNQGDLKAILFSLTGVPPDRMKLVGLIKGKLPGDNEEVVKLGLGGPTTTTKKKEFMMIGTPEGQEHKSVGPVNTGDEPDIDYATAGAATREALKAMESIRNRRKLKETAEGLQLDKMREPRMGKKLLGKIAEKVTP